MKDLREAAETELRNLWAGLLCYVTPSAELLKCGNFL